MPCAWRWLLAYFDAWAWREGERPQSRGSSPFAACQPWPPSSSSRPAESCQPNAMASRVGLPERCDENQREGRGKAEEASLCQASRVITCWYSKWYPFSKVISIKDTESDRQQPTLSSCKYLDEGSNKSNVHARNENNWGILLQCVQSEASHCLRWPNE